MEAQISPPGNNLIDFVRRFDHGSQSNGGGSAGANGVEDV